MFVFLKFLFVFLGSFCFFPEKKMEFVQKCWSILCLKTGLCWDQIFDLYSFFWWIYQKYNGHFWHHFWDIFVYLSGSQNCFGNDSNIVIVCCYIWNCFTLLWILFGVILEFSLACWDSRVWPLDPKTLKNWGFFKVFEYAYFRYFRVLMVLLG